MICITGGKSVENFNNLNKLLREEKKPSHCEKCNGPLVFVGGGAYKCKKCGAETLDDFGKIKTFLEKNGPAPAFVIARETGVKKEAIKKYLQNGRIEMLR